MNGNNEDVTKKCKTCEFEFICEMPDFVRENLKNCRTYNPKKATEEKGDNKVVIKQVGYTYIFQIANVLRPEEQERRREEIKKQLKEGVVFIDGAVKLVSVEPHLETFAEQ